MRQFDPDSYIKDVSSATSFIRTCIRGKHPDFQPGVVLTLGSGLGDLAKQIDAFAVLPYASIPNFPTLTVEGHKGELVLGYLRDVPVVGLSGRKHFYEVAQESHGMMKVVFPVHVMASLGAEVYFATNAVGGLNQRFEVGDLVVIKDHIDLFFPDPLTGPHVDFGDNSEFQPQNMEYDDGLRKCFLRAADEVSEKTHVYEGIYAARTGRTYETAATSRALRGLGADTVGMSVIPEVIIATNRGMKTIAVSIVTNKIAEDGTNATSHKEVKAILDSEKTRDRLSKVFSRFFELYKDSR